MIQRLSQPENGLRYVEILSSIFENTNGNDSARRPQDSHDLSALALLPPHEEMRSLLNEYFRYANSILPLHHESTFVNLVEQLYRRIVFPRPALLACINLVIAIVYSQRIWRSSSPDI